MRIKIKSIEEIKNLPYDLIKSNRAGWVAIRGTAVNSLNYCWVETNSVYEVISERVMYNKMYYKVQYEHSGTTTVGWVEPELISEVIHDCS